MRAVEALRGRLPAAGVLLPLALTAVFASLALWRPILVEDSIEHLLLDWRFKARNLLAPPATPEGVVIVAVDEASLARHGRWPWTRPLVADLLDRVRGAGPRAVGVDLFFAESETPEADARLARAFEDLGERGVGALVFEIQRDDRGAEEVPDVLFDQAVSKVEQAGLLRPLKARRPLLPPGALAAATRFGHVNYLPDRNGKLRWEYLYLRSGGETGEYFLSLSLQAARIALGVAPEQVRIVGGSGVDLGGRMIPADDNGRLLVNYYGPEGTFAHIPATDVLAGEVPPERLRDKVVFVGATGVATYDIIVTPFAANMAGVEKNATVAANVIAGDYLRRVPLVVDLLAVLAAGVAALLLTRRRSAAAAILSLLGLAALIVGGNVAAFVTGWHLNLAYPFLLVVAQGTGTVAVRYLIEERRARQMRRMFSSYVTERVVDQLIENPELARLGGQRREVTVLFSDIRGFTTFSEHHPPERVVAILNDYLEAMTEVVFHWEGTLDKFIGDAIMVFWNAPLPQEDHAERAIRCALHMLGRLDALNRGWAEAGQPVLEIGIGLNTGEVLVGNIGAEGRKMDYTVIGDHVNLASRLEGLTKKYGARILLTESTLERIRPLLDRNAFGHVTVRALERVAVKGKEQGVGVYEFATHSHGERTTVEGSIGSEVVRMTEK